MDLISVEQMCLSERRLSFRALGSQTFRRSLRWVTEDELKEYGGDPIQCWLPAELASQKSWEQYAENYCFVENTYYIPLDQNVPQNEKHLDTIYVDAASSAIRNTSYLLENAQLDFNSILQEMVIFNENKARTSLLADVQTRAVISMTDSVRQMDPYSDEAHDTVDAIASHIYHADKSTKHLHKIQNSNLVPIWKARIFTQSYLSIIYLITKLLFVTNATVQFWLVSLYLGGNGYDLTKALIKQQTWQSTGLFPRVTMCDFKEKSDELAENSDPCYGQRTPPHYSMRPDGKYAEREDIHRSLVQPHEAMTSHLTQLFVEQFAGDTALVLRLVTQNASEIVASSVAARLFDIFARKSVEGQRESCCSGGKREKHDMRRTLPISALSAAQPEAIAARNNSSCNP
ncbi:unnamed protein product [Litomosoides sigmodontis]|uniref:Innexin n=1 Tax=Litomosoides sigmodontis TaxID=42156 RepID=A0A3P6T3G3_LITSI|nr:unnamed protein product [Litomosoides sigmodontis]